MNDEPMVEAEYVGLKDKETDCVAGTGLTWVGLGSRHMVPASAWEVMKKHTDVWRKVEPKRASAGATGDGGLSDSVGAEDLPPRAIPDNIVEMVSKMSYEEAVAAYEREIGQAPPRRLKPGVLRDTLIKALREKAV